MTKSSATICNISHVDKMSYVVSIFCNPVVAWYFMRPVWAAVVLAKLFSRHKKLTLTLKFNSKILEVIPDAI
ncbi:MAG: hypothetical protein LBK06_08975 [Planctomycetaceae bacterium]|nr:hypothetical protein [Planctomycetaceae bacterium]